MATIATVAPRLRYLINEGNATETLAQARALLCVDPHDLNICHIASVFIIDAAAELDDIVAVNEGIALIDRLVAAMPVDGDTYIQNRYNQSNGYAALYHHYRRSGSTDLAADALQDQKKILQELLLRKTHIPSDLIPNVLTNYANCLDHLSRTFEAIDHFLVCLDTCPNHTVAKGNCGMTLPRVTAWTKEHHLENYLASWDLLSASVSAPERVLAYATPSALDNFKTSLSELRQRIALRFPKGVDTLEQFRVHRAEAHSAPPKRWLTEVLRDRLLLSFNQLPLASKDEAIDDAFIDGLSYGLSPEDEKESLEILYLLNTIKEEFASARYLYYHALRDRGRLKNWKYPGRIRDTRNATVHRWLTLHFATSQDNSGEDRRWSLEDFAELSLFILRQSKAAALLLFAAINVEEQRRRRETRGQQNGALIKPLFVGSPPSSTAKRRGQQRKERPKV